MAYVAKRIWLYKNVRVYCAYCNYLLTVLCCIVSMLNKTSICLSWKHISRQSKSWELEKRTFSPAVASITLDSGIGMEIACSNRNWKSSVLFWSFLKNSCHLCGTGTWSVVLSCFIIIYFTSVSYFQVTVVDMVTINGCLILAMNSSWVLRQSFYIKESLYWKHICILLFVLAF